MSREAKIADKDFAKQIAADYSSGMLNKDIAEKHEVRPETISDWVNDPRVLVHIKENASQRKERITRLIDGELENRISNPAMLKGMDAELLIKIRKELLGPIQKNIGKEGQDMTSSLMDLLDENPELQSALSNSLKDK
jgi:hypothetical protein